jgi:hypothetical protein
MQENISKNANQTAISNWDDEGGAGASDDQQKGPEEGGHGDAQKRLDSSHESDVRGEHRYSGVHQTPADRQARQDRDDLKTRLASRARKTSVTMNVSAPDRRREEDRRDKRPDDAPAQRRNDEVPANRTEDPRLSGGDEEAEPKDRRSILPSHAALKNVPGEQ